MKKYLVLILCLISAFVIVSCKDKKEEVVDHGEVIGVIVDEESVKESYEYDEFDIESIKLIVTYADDYTETISLTNDMISDSDIERLKSAGQPRITINYEGIEIKQVIKLIDSSLLDKDLNVNGDYDAVLKAIRSNNTINFILEPNKGVNGLQVEYLFDTSIMQLDESSIKCKLDGVFYYTLNNGKLTVIYSQLENITTETTIFSVNFTGNFRTSKLRINNDFNNTLCTNIDESYNYSSLDSVLYHVSIK